MFKNANRRVLIGQIQSEGVSSLLLPDGSRAFVISSGLYNDALRAADAEMSKIVTQLKVKRERGKARRAA